MAAALSSRAISTSVVLVRDTITEPAVIWIVVSVVPFTVLLSATTRIGAVGWACGALSCLGTCTNSGLVTLGLGALCFPSDSGAPGLYPEPILVPCAFHRVSPEHSQRPAPLRVRPIYPQHKLPAHNRGNHQFLLIPDASLGRTGLPRIPSEAITASKTSGPFKVSLIISPSSLRSTSSASSRSVHAPPSQVHPHLSSRPPADLAVSIGRQQLLYFTAFHFSSPPSLSPSIFFARYRRTLTKSALSPINSAISLICQVLLISQHKRGPIS